MNTPLTQGGVAGNARVCTRGSTTASRLAGSA